MANQDNGLPEGTDSIISGASRTDGSGAGLGTGSTGATTTAGITGGGGTSLGGDASSSTGTTGSFNRDRAVESLRSGTEKLSGQAAEKARGLVGQGLERGSEALANVSKLIGDTAGGLDERLGSQYGDYARKAATTIEETANRLASKDADELIEDTRGFVRKSPGVALAGAAVLGFALVRLVKSGLDLPSEKTGTGNDNGTQI
ncbi:MAG: hypothetical protein M3R03_06630 [Pseudomonadota bacterium]|nr:hypothetical protein [Pseudomonadota bacterium]